jgi:hypothetical protein
VSNTGPMLLGFAFGMAWASRSVILAARRSASGRRRPMATMTERSTRRSRTIQARSRDRPRGAGRAEIRLCSRWGASPFVTVPVGAGPTGRGTELRRPAGHRRHQRPATARPDTGWPRRASVSHRNSRRPALEACACSPAALGPAVLGGPAGGFHLGQGGPAAGPVDTGGVPLADPGSSSGLEVAGAVEGALGPGHFGFVQAIYRFSQGVVERAPFGTDRGRHAGVVEFHGAKFFRCWSPSTAPSLVAASVFGGTKFP